jgi:hypothetical protein
MTPSTLSLGDFYTQLNVTMSDYHARNVIRTVLTTAGLTVTDHSEKLSIDNARSLCLELIKKGGPSFQVGKNIYQSIGQ